MDLVTMMMNVMEKEFALSAYVLEKQDLKKMHNIITMKEKQETDAQAILLIINVMEIDNALITDGAQVLQDDLISITLS